MIQKTQSIENLARLYDSTRLVVGVRHPIGEDISNFHIKHQWDLL